MAATAEARQNVANVELVLESISNLKEALRVDEREDHQWSLAGQIVVALDSWVRAAAQYVPGGAKAVDMARGYFARRDAALKLDAVHDRLIEDAIEHLRKVAGRLDGVEAAA